MATKTTKRAKAFGRVSGCQFVRWLYNNKIAKESVQKILKRFGVAVKEACVAVIYCPCSKKFNGAKLTAKEAAEVKRAAK